MTCRIPLYGKRDRLDEAVTALEEQIGAARSRVDTAKEELKRIQRGRPLRAFAPNNSTGGSNHGN